MSEGFFSLVENRTEKIDMSLNSDVLWEQTKQYQSLMMIYKCAIKEVTTKFEILNEELAMQHNRNPIEFITHRIKKPISVVNKLKKNNFPLTIESIRENLNDIAGVKVVCSFIDDIYYVADMLIKQDDITLIEIKDYIKNPKANGYRSFHIIIEIPVFFSNRKENVRVEIQLRTIAMDFWASLEHDLKYKKSISNEKEIYNRLALCASVISEVDNEMQNIRKKIEVSDEIEQIDLTKEDDGFNDIFEKHETWTQRLIEQIPS